MDTIQIINTLPNEHRTENFTLATGEHHYQITIMAGHASTLRLFCTGTQVAGSLMLDMQLAQGATVHVGIAGTVCNADTWTIKSIQNHTAPQATSRLVVRKVVSDTAHATYYGTIHIAPEAVGTVVSQDDKTLLDGLYARAESQPVLEVLTDAVSCSHGSALGRLDPALLWYVQSRGVSQAGAQQLCYTAFLDEACDFLFTE